MTWFVAWVVMECEVVGAPPLCDEQLRVIEAPDAEEAYRLAVELGEAEAHSYENGRGETVHWIFKGLSELEEILADRLESGTEVCSVLHDGTRGEELVRPKDDLSTSRSELDKDKTAAELLDPSRRPYAPL